MIELVLKPKDGRIASQQKIAERLTKLTRRTPGALQRFAGTGRRRPPRRQLRAVRRARVDGHGVISGLVIGSGLTLYVIPAVYLMLAGRAGTAGSAEPIAAASAEPVAK